MTRVLALIRDDVLFPGHPDCPVTSPNTPDEVWLPIVGENQWVALMRDKHIRTRPRERRALIAHNVRAFVLTGAGNYARWQILELLVRRWSEIVAAADSLPGPYIYSVTRGGLSRLTP